MSASAFRVAPAQRSEPGETSLSVTRTIGVLTNEARDQGVSLGRRLATAALEQDPVAAVDLAVHAARRAGMSEQTMLDLAKAEVSVREDLDQLKKPDFMTGVGPHARSAINAVLRLLDADALDSDEERAVAAMFVELGYGGRRFNSWRIARRVIADRRAA